MTPRRDAAPHMTPAERAKWNAINRTTARGTATILRDLIARYGGWGHVPLEYRAGGYGAYTAAQIQAELVRLDAVAAGKTLTDDDDAMLLGGHEPGYSQNRDGHGRFAPGDGRESSGEGSGHDGGSGSGSGGGGGGEARGRKAPSIEEIKARIGAGVRTEGDAIAVGDMVRARIHEHMGRYYTEVVRTDQEMRAAGQRYLTAARDGEPSPALRRGWESAERAHADALAAYDGMLRHATASVLGQVREVGGEEAILTTWRGPETLEHDGDLRALGAVRAASESMPTDWIRASNDLAAREAAAAGMPPGAEIPHGVYVRSEDMPEGYSGTYTGHMDGMGLITMRPGADAREAQTTAAHEWGHRIEHAVPGIAEMERAFYDRRTAGDLMQPLSPRQTQIAVKADRFADRYIGAVPRLARRTDGSTHHYYEILSRGLEWTFGPRFGGRPLFLQDPEYHAFILGLLAGA